MSAVSELALVEHNEVEQDGNQEQTEGSEEEDGTENDE